jgi:DeoR/GlpR family transcriptional regulator of sugar metabolism
MIPAQRQHLIMEKLSHSGVVTIAALSDDFGVSQMTVRRDIEKLERAGRVMSVTGGVQLPQRILSEPSHTAKTHLRYEQKVAIGRKAAEMIPSRGVIYIDAGTTTLEIARQLIGHPDLIIVTNDFIICETLAAGSQCQLHHTGGYLDRQNLSSVGEGAALGLSRFNLDIAFISTSSWGMQGISTPSEDKIALKRVAAERASRSVLVTDSTKYGKIGPFSSLPLRAFRTIVTDWDLPDSVRHAITDLGVDVVVADPITETDIAAIPSMVPA